MKFKNITFLGTSHIAAQSLKEVRNHIEEIQPEVIAIELDRKRLPALMSKEQKKISIKAIKYIGVKGYLFSLIGAWAEKKLGKLVGVSPGSEMKEAIQIAREKGIELALVDQDIEITLRRLSKAITWREKMNFLTDLIKGLFNKKAEIEFDLRTVPNKNIIKKMVGKLKKRYPNFYNVLIDERNKVIANNLEKLISSNHEKKILVILGAGHVDDVIEILKKREKSSISYSFSVGN